MGGKTVAKRRALKPWSPSPDAATARENYLLFAQQQAPRFWSKTKRSASGCLEWTGGLDKDGYGKFQISLPRLVQGKQQQCHIRAHRLAFELTNGRVPEGLLVLHSCDNPRCVEPAHLSAGSQLQNRRDAVARGRVPFGERHHSAKLTEEQAREVIRLRAAGHSDRKIASQFNVTKSAIGHVGTYNWKRLA